MGIQTRQFAECVFDDDWIEMEVQSGYRRKFRATKDRATVTLRYVQQKTKIPEEYIPFKQGSIVSIQRQIFSYGDIDSYDSMFEYIPSSR